MAEIIKSPTEGIKQAASVAQPVQTVVPKFASPLSSTPMHNGMYVPANWDIQPTEKGVRCVNNLNGVVFEGTIEEFNKAMKG